MKIKQIKIKNFRAYREQVSIDFNNLNVLVGKNDIGKSTILEALDIFFNESKGIIKIDKDDLNKIAAQAGEKDITISISFTGYSEQLDLDAEDKTILENEYLLNSENYLEIKKVYTNGKPTVYIVANHPNGEHCQNLLQKKQSDLKKLVEENDFPCTNKTINAELRKSIWENTEYDLEIKDIEVSKANTEAKAIWDNLQKYMPVYALFQSDRSNNDQDNEVQDPMKLAVQEILKTPELQTKLNEIATVVGERTKEIADATLTKLREMNPELANELKPVIPPADQLKWGDVFKKIGISSDDDIPLNKRGSGVKRLVLLNFFRAEADRRTAGKDSANAIYAIEEPETSQHPDHQRLLIDAFLDLSETKNTQVILTTHSPSIAQLLPTEDIRLIKKGDEGAVDVYAGENIILETAQTLGVLPTLSKVVICVEGDNDRNFLLNINRHIPELRSIVDLESEHISIIPMGGSKLKSWVERDYLKQSSVIEFHLYDKDHDLKYASDVGFVNDRPDQSKGVLTVKREFENYIHHSLITGFEKFSHIDTTKITDWDEDDIPKYICSKCDLDESKIKQILNGHVMKGMTKSHFEEGDAWELEFRASKQQ